MAYYSVRLGAVSDWQLDMPVLQRDSSIQPERSAAQTFAGHIIVEAAKTRLPDLFHEDGCPALYRLLDRRGVSVVVVRTSDLGRDQLIALLRYRLAQYLVVGYVDPERALSERWEHEPLEHVHEDDIHVVAGNARTGEILCYLTLQAQQEAPSASTLRTRERTRLPLEELFGWGIYNRLRILPDLPVSRVREFSHFVKNQRLDPRDELAMRAPIEVGVALFWALTGPLHPEIDAIIGQYELRGSKRNLDYFYVPQVVLHGARRCTDAGHPQYRHWLETPYVPFAFWVPDLFSALPRVKLVEESLRQPGVGALLRLVERDYSHSISPSSMLPERGLPRITTGSFDEPSKLSADQQPGVHDLAHRLLATRLFGSLSATEAVTLATLCTQLTIQPGRAVVRQGQPGSGLYLIETGMCEVRRHDGVGGTRTVGHLRAGACAGAAALVTGRPEPATVIAIEPTQVLRISPRQYEGLFSGLVEVEYEVQRAAVLELADVVGPAGFRPCARPSHIASSAAD